MATSNAAGMGWIGQMVENPFNRSEYVTIDRVDEKGQRFGKTKAGKTLGLGGGAVDVTGSAGTTKTRVTPGASTSMAPKPVVSSITPPAVPTAVKAPGSAPTDLINSMSMPAGEGMSSKPENTIKYSDDYKQGKMAAAGLGFMVDVLNAQSAYRGTTGAAQLNIIQARNRAADAIYRGRQAQADAQSQGIEAGEDLSISLAAQGQDLSGAGAQKVRNSMEAMGVYAGMREEMNSISEALGFELEEVSMDYAMENAKIERDFSMIGAALNFGANAYSIGTM